MVSKQQSLNYAWDDTSSRKKHLVVNIAGKERSIDLLQFGTQKPLVVQTFTKQFVTIGLQVLADGPVIILHITELNRDIKDKTNLGSQDNIQRTASVSSDNFKNVSSFSFK